MATSVRISELDLERLIANPPKLHAREGVLISDWRIDDTTCCELNRRISSGLKTLETGAGLSTIIFAAAGCDHTCIMPDQELADRISAYCHSSQIDTSNVKFVISSSTDAIHQLQPGFDLALIDGNHGFPVAIVDFYYATKLLKIGGTLIVDDMHIFTCRLIASYMKEDSGWHMQLSTNRVAIGTKIADTIDAEWNAQPFVTNKGSGVVSIGNPVAAVKATVSALRREGIKSTIAKAAHAFRRI